MSEREEGGGVGGGVESYFHFSRSAEELINDVREEGYAEVTSGTGSRAT